MQFTIVDGVVALIVLVSGVLAYSRGFTREVIAIGGWIAAALAAFYFAPLLEPLIRELPVVGPVLAKSCVISMIAAVTLIVAGCLLVLAVFTPLFSSVILDSPLAPLDRMLGFVFGVARGVLLLAVAYLIYDRLSGGGETWGPLADAASKTIFDEAARLIGENLPEEIPGWFGGRVDALMAHCGEEVPGLSDNAAGN